MWGHRHQVKELFQEGMSDQLCQMLLRHPQKVGREICACTRTHHERRMEGGYGRHGKMLINSWDLDVGHREILCSVLAPTCEVASK